MPKLESEAIERVHVWLYASDIAAIRTRFGGTVGFSKAIRAMIRQMMKEIDLKVAAKAQHVEVKSEDIDLTGTETPSQAPSQTSSQTRT